MFELVHMVTSMEDFVSAQPASLGCLPVSSKLFQGFATMTYTRSHTRPSQKDLGCVVYPLNNKSLVYPLNNKSLVYPLNNKSLVYPLNNKSLAETPQPRIWAYIYEGAIGHLRQTTSLSDPLAMLYTYTTLWKKPFCFSFPPENSRIKDRNSHCRYQNNLPAAQRVFLN